MNVVTCNQPSRKEDIDIRYNEELQQLEVWTQHEYGYSLAGCCFLAADPAVFVKRITDIAKDMFAIGYAVRARETQAFLASSDQR